MMINSRYKVNVAVVLFIVWMLVQAVRSAVGGEPYPAIKYPGFPGNGKAALTSRELYKVAGKERTLITHYESVYGHARYRKLLQDITVAVDNNDENARLKMLSGLRDIKGLQRGDTVEIVERTWQATKSGYAENAINRRQIVL